MTANIRLKEDLVKSFNKFIEENKSLNKRDLLKIINDVYNNNNKENKEKKPLNSYQIFLKENYAIIQEQEKLKGDVKPGQIMAMVGKLWKEKKEGKEIIKINEITEEKEDTDYDEEVEDLDVKEEEDEEEERRREEEKKKEKPQEKKRLSRSKK
jgi:hypothetical protein